MKIVISAAVVAALLVGCGEEKPKETKAVVAPVEASVKIETKVTGALEKAGKKADVLVSNASEMSVSVISQTRETYESVKETTSDVLEKSKEIAVEASKKIETAAVAVVDTVEEVLATSSEAGAEVYKSCANCHGQQAQKAALGKSQIIKGWSASKVRNALNGYKDGSYGGSMKGVMKGQVSRLSDEDVREVSIHVSSL